MVKKTKATFTYIEPTKSWEWSRTRVIRAEAIELILYKILYFCIVPYCYRPAFL